MRKEHDSKKNTPISLNPLTNSEQHIIEPFAKAQLY